MKVRLLFLNISSLKKENEFTKKSKGTFLEFLWRCQHEKHEQDQHTGQTIAHKVNLLQASIIRARIFTHANYTHTQKLINVTECYG